MASFGRSANLVPQLTLVSGTFLVAIGLATLGWLRIVFDGEFILTYGFPNLISLVENAMLFVGIGLICGSLLLTKIVLRKANVLPRNLQVDLMFLIGSFLFIQGESLDGDYGGGFFLQIEVAYFLMFLGLGLFAASLFLLNNERRRGSRVGLRWEILIAGSLSLIATDLFPLGSDFWGFSFYPFLPTPLLFILGIALVSLVIGIVGLGFARRMRARSPSAVNTGYVATKVSHRSARFSVAIILVIVAFMVFLSLPIFPYNNGCVHGVETALASYFGFGCF